MRLLITLLCSIAVSSAQISTIHVDGLRSKNVRLVAYTNCTAIPEPGKRIDNAVIIVHGEYIVSIGSGTSIPAGADVRDMKGAWVYAGFVDPYLDLKDFSGKGRSEKDNTAGHDGDEDEDGGPMTPEPTGAHYWNEAVRPERKATDVLKITESAAKEFNELGILSGSIASHDGVFSGLSAGVNVRPGPSSKVVVVDETSQLLSFGKGSSKTPYPTSQMGSIALIRQAFFDADWYGKVHGKSSPDAKLPETNISLEALNASVQSKKPFIVKTQDEHDVVRWGIIASEVNIKPIIVGSGSEYRRLATMAQLKSEMGAIDFIMPLTLPQVPDVSDPIDARNVPLTDLMHWYWAADNSRLLDSLGCRIAFTTSGLKDRSSYISNIRQMVERGFDTAKAIAAITTVPAEYSGLSNFVGTIAAKKFANLVFTSGNLFDKNTTIRAVVVAGNESNVERGTSIDVRGKWTLTSSALTKSLTLDIKGTPEKPTATVKLDTVTINSTFSVSNNRVNMSLNLDTMGIKGTTRATAPADSIMLTGALTMPDGRNVAFVANRSERFVAEKPKPEEKKIARRALPPTLPLGPFGFDKKPDLADVVLKNATVWTCGAQGIQQNTDVVIKDGKVSAVGKNLSAGTSIDCSGMHITPGIIDEHSHIAISRGVNEGSHAVTTEVRIGDVLYPDDITIYRQMAAGVTGSHLLHGSANPMGGQLQFIRMRWGADAEGLKWQGAKPTVKFALGENVKQSNWGDRYTVRYPQTRMGVEEIMRDAFRAAREYETQLSSAGVGGAPVRRDIQLDALVEILNSKRNIHCHSYVQSEILMLMRLAEEFGFRVWTFTHILEGYKVAEEMAKHGAMASSFADWWAYKFEVYDAIPQNPAIMHEQGVVVSVNSDDGEMARRLNQEAAKSVAQGGVSEEDALKFCTLNAAKQMGVADVVGSVEAGKEADILVWSGNPLSNFSRVEHTFIEGREMFSRAIDAKLRTRDAELRSFLEQAALKAIADGATPTKDRGRGRREYHCDTMDDEMSGTHLHD